MVKKIDHIGIIVKDADEAVKTYSEMFGFEVVEEMGGAGRRIKNRPGKGRRYHT